MKFFRFSIANLMTLVAIVAVDVAACQTLLIGRELVSRELAEIIILGILPMGNLLAILSFSNKSDGTNWQQRLIGFEIFGVAGLALFVVVSLLDTRWIYYGVINILNFFGFVRVPARPIGAFLILIMPQMAVGMLGAWLMRKPPREPDDRTNEASATRNSD